MVNFRAWLYQVARHCLIDHQRKRKPQSLGDRDLTDSRSGQAEETLTATERMEVLRGCLKQLRTELASLVQARLAGESYDVICARLGLARPGAPALSSSQGAAAEAVSRPTHETVGHVHPG